MFDSIISYLSQPPPPWVLWFTTILASLLSILKLVDYWLKRERLELWPLVAEQYYIEFGKDEAAKWDYMGAVHQGDPRELFTVIEFTLTNRYQKAITLGRINVGGWMFSDRYLRRIYDHARDYRVFDLHTREQTSLAYYGSLKSEETIGFRIEAYEHQGSVFGTEPKNKLAEMRSRQRMRIPTKYSVAVQTSAGTKEFTVKIERTQQLLDSTELATVYRLSGTELLPTELQPSVNGLPQGVSRTDHDVSMINRIRPIVRDLKYRMQVLWRQQRGR